MTVLELIHGMTQEQRAENEAALRLECDLAKAEKENDIEFFIGKVKTLYFPRLELQCGAFETIFDNVDAFSKYHADWTRLNMVKWNKLLRTVAVKYNVIHNTDRTQEETVTTTNEDMGFSKSKDNSSGSNVTEHTENGENTALHQLSAANQTDFHNKTKDSTTDKKNGKVEETQSQNGERENKYNSEQKTEVKHTIRAYGNIGVTTNQQMLHEERQHAAFEMLNYIVDDFKKEFCIMIY